MKISASHLLGVGVVCGLLLAIFGATERVGLSRLPADTAASVNGVLISNAEYAAALSRLAGDSRESLDSGDSDWVLNRLIEEELLVQRALDAGLAKSESSVRNSLIRILMDSLTKDSQSATVTDAELKDWYRANLGMFSGEPRYRVAVYRFESKVDAESASTTELLGSLGDERYMPDAVLPLKKIRDYGGAALVQQLSSLGNNEISAAFFSNQRWSRAWVKERLPGGLLDFDESRQIVESEWRRQKADEAIRRYLEKLKSQATIVSREEPAS